MLTDADFTNAIIEGCWFDWWITQGTGLSRHQLYSTKSYRMRELSEIKLNEHTLDDWDFANQNLTRAGFLRASLRNTDFSDAIVAGADFGSTTSRGFSQQQLYSTKSYKAKNLHGLRSSYNDLTNWSFAEQDLSEATFVGDMLLGADFSGSNLSQAVFVDSTLHKATFANALVTGADFTGTTANGFTNEQLYSTASYKAKDLSGVSFGWYGNGENDLSGWDFSGQDLRAAKFERVRLTNADFSFADLRGAEAFDGHDAILRNAISPDGAMSSVTLLAGEQLRIHWEPYTPAIVEEAISIASRAALEIELDQPIFGSNSSPRVVVHDGAAVDLGGTLRIVASQDWKPSEFVGWTYAVFDWPDAIEPSNIFDNVDVPPGTSWDLASLYTTGEVTLVLSADTNGDQTVDLNDLNNVRNNFGASGLGDTNGDQVIDLVDLNNVRNFFGATPSAQAVPEPASLVLAWVAILAGSVAALRISGCRWQGPAKYAAAGRVFSNGVALLAAIGCGTRQAHAAPPYSEIVVFGDSISDVGNWPLNAGFRNGVFPPPYFGGRLSNGPLWIEHLADLIGVPRPTPSLSGGSNFAWAGGTTGSMPGEDVNMDVLVRTYLDERAPQPDELFVLWGGANDFFGGQSDPAAPAEWIGDHVERLADAGARNFLVVNLPTRYGSTSLNAGLTPNAVAFNAHLASVLDNIRSTYSEVIITEFDYFSFFEKVIANSLAFGFHDTVNPACHNCFGNPTVVPNPQEYFSWDDAHPTATAHQLIAAAAHAAITPQPGDTNFDMTVDLDDLNNVRNSFGGTGAGVLGDTNGDQIVDLVDLNNVRNFFGATAPQAVPEPATFAIACVTMATIAVVAWSRKKSAVRV